MQNFHLYFQVVVSILLAIAILLQQKSAGLSATFGGGGSSYSSKRGFDKFLESVTIILAILFFASALAYIFV